MMLEFSNPANVHTPLGLYSHTVTVPTATELIYLSGQLGVRPDGSTPASIEEQADQVFANIVALLRAHGLEPSSIVKLSTFMVAGQNGQAVREARLKHLGTHRPASTAVYVSQLVDPKWLVEVEAIAARRPGLSSAKRASESAHPPG
jgi:2-iminobutanoate/2-iminopropanoate deaminase